MAVNLCFAHALLLRDALIENGSTPIHPQTIRFVPAGSHPNLRVCSFDFVQPIFCTVPLHHQLLILEGKKKEKTKAPPPPNLFFFENSIYKLYVDWITKRANHLFDDFDVSLQMFDLLHLKQGKKCHSAAVKDLLFLSSPIFVLAF